MPSNLAIPEDPTSIERLHPEPMSLQDITTEALHDLGQMINDINDANGWDVCQPDDWGEDGNPYKIPAVISLCHSELSEALEAYRHNDEGNFIEEMADTLIRIIDCTHGLSMDLAGAVFAKLAVNRTRGHRHGGKRV
jgi:NTP pyrophosphatase (non-canonical NTP hydrolase)